MCEARWHDAASKWLSVIKYLVELRIEPKPGPPAHICRLKAVAEPYDDIARMKETKAQIPPEVID